MVDSQPGTVITFNPSLTLSNFASRNRDRFMYNENQLVLAKVQQPQAVSASAFNRSSLNVLTEFNNYRNLQGQLAYIDNLFYDLSTPGVPTLPVHRIAIGFDLQVTTDVLKIWSVGFIDTSLLFAEYSFDNVTWFSVNTTSPSNTVNWSFEFDDTIEVFPGDSPPTGEFVYTGTFTNAITARYWRIRSDASSPRVSGTANTITVVSTNFFASSGTIMAVKPDGTVRGTYTFATKNATTFSTVAVVTGSMPAVDDTIISIADPFGNRVTEFHVVQTLSPILEHWNSDGSQAVTNAIEGSQYLDICYDRTDDGYYAIRFDDGSNLAAAVDPDDNFNDEATGDGFDTGRWIENSVNNYFIHSTASGTLDMKSSGGAGQLEGNYGVEGNFVAQIDLVAALRLPTPAYFALEAKDFSSGNQQIVSALKGNYIPGTSTNGKFVGATLSYTNTVGDAAQLQNFRIRPGAFDFGFPGGVVNYQFTYSSALDEYTVTVSGITWPNATPGVSYSLDSASFTISNITTPSNGQGFTVAATCAQANILGTVTSGIRLEIERNGTSGIVKYTDTGPHTLMTGNVSEDRWRPQLYGNPMSQTVDISADNFLVTGGTVVFVSPVFSVVTLDKDGNLTQVAGISNSEGYAIRSLDIIRDPQATYNNYLAPRVGIATNGAAEGSGGEIYIKVNDTLYKYLKTALPLMTENGSSASAMTIGEIPSTGITNFAHHGYSQAGLSYIEFIPDLDGVFLKTISTTTLEATPLKVKLDVPSINFPFAWNVSDLSTLYYVDDDDLKLYDLNESKAAFVNVTSDKQVLAAGTGEVAIITAQVLNVYGEPKSAKTMTFSVSAGDGAISPATGCSDLNGQDTTSYTVGAAVGTATITVSVSDTTCVP